MTTILLLLAGAALVGVGAFGLVVNRPLVTSLGLEKEINTFFRLTSPSVIRRLREAFPDLPDNPDQKTVFLKLRELRNKW